jgi:hypothetical protein
VATALTAIELHRLHKLAADARVHGPPMTDAEWRAHEVLREKLVRMIAEAGSTRALAAMVFRWVIPLFKSAPLKAYKLALAPTLNAYGSMKPWMQAQLRKELDLRLLAEVAKWPACRLLGERRPRAVRVTRYSSVTPDEIGVDVLGGKVPVDRLVRAGILAGDTGALLQREARWEKAPPGGGHLLVEVFDLE